MKYTIILGFCKSGHIFINLVKKYCYLPDLLTGLCTYGRLSPLGSESITLSVIFLSTSFTGILFALLPLNTAAAHHISTREMIRLYAGPQPPKFD